MIEAEADGAGRARSRSWAATSTPTRSAAGWSSSSATGCMDLPPPALFGRHQFANAGLAVAALTVFDHPRIDERRRRARRRVRRLARTFPARCATARSPSAPRPAAPTSGSTARTIRMPAARWPRRPRRWRARDGRPVVLISGMLGRKDARGFFDAFEALRPRVFTTSFESPSATPPEDLAAAARAAGLEAEVADGVEQALARALEPAGPAPHVIIAGSLHFVGDVLAMTPGDLADLTLRPYRSLA